MILCRFIVLISIKLHHLIIVAIPEIGDLPENATALNNTAITHD